MTPTCALRYHGRPSVPLYMWHRWEVKARQITPFGTGDRSLGPPSLGGVSREDGHEHPVVDTLRRTGRLASQRHHGHAGTRALDRYRPRDNRGGPRRVVVQPVRRRWCHRLQPRQPACRGGRRHRRVGHRQALPSSLTGALGLTSCFHTTNELLAYRVLRPESDLLASCQRRWPRGPSGNATTHGGHDMNRDVLQGNWKQLRGNIKEQW